MRNIGLRDIIRLMAKKRPITPKKSRKKRIYKKKYLRRNKKQTSLLSSLEKRLNLQIKQFVKIATVQRLKAKKLLKKRKRSIKQLVKFTKQKKVLYKKKLLKLKKNKQKLVLSYLLNKKKLVEKLLKKYRRRLKKSKNDSIKRLTAIEKNLKNVSLKIKKQKNKKKIKQVIIYDSRRKFKNSLKKWSKKWKKYFQKKYLKTKLPLSEKLNWFRQSNIWWAEQKIKFTRPKPRPKYKKRGRPKKKVTWYDRLPLPKIIRKLLYPFVYLFEHYTWQTLFSLSLSILILLGSRATYKFIFEDLPSPLELTDREQLVSTRILDRNGKILFSFYENENRTLIPLSQVPMQMVQATIAIEDQDFYDHRGFSVRGIARALVANARGLPTQGGSTITQQLVKNRLLSPERTVRRKVREVLLAILAEGAYSKEEILEMYLNQVAYGGATYGIEEAAQRYFGKHASELSLAESAMLAGLPVAPSVFTPFGPTPELAFARQEEVLRRMAEEDFITLEQAEAARREILVFRNDSIDIRAPHFVMYIKRLLAESYGYDVVNKGGLEVRTTLDLDLQDAAQDVVTEELNRLARLRVSNGASLVTNPLTGEVLAMVGSKDYFDFENDGQVNVTLRPRQPGSSIKPINYALAFSRGKSPSSTIDDSPVTYHVPGSKPYSPKNYDGAYHGRVTLRQALASSYNIPAVKLLAENGVSNMIDLAENLGITTWKDRSRFGLSLTLGGGDILMIDLAKVYGTFANKGETVDINPILEIKNYQGEVIYSNTCALQNTDCPKTRTLDEKVAYQISNILSDNRSRTAAFGPRSVLHIPGQEVAVKTGTTNNLRDNWTIGYTTDRLVAVWVGNNDNTPMSYVASGITGASPIWNNIMRLLLSEEEPHRFDTPTGLIKVKICASTGTLVCTGCPRVSEELFVPGTEPTRACNPEWFKPKDEAGAEDLRGENRDRILEGATLF